MADKEKAEKDTKSTDPVQMEVGGSGDATVTFKDDFGNDVPAKDVQWISSGNVVVEPNTEDSSKAKLLAVGPGPSTVKAQGTGPDGGFAEATLQVMALHKGVASTGEITATVTAAPVKKKEEKPAEKKPDQQPAHATTQHH